MLVATHALSVPVDGGEPFSQVVHRLAGVSAEIADLPQPAPSATESGPVDRHPVADVLFALQDTGLSDVDIAGSRPRWRPELTGAVLFDLALHVEPRREGDEALWGYATTILEQRTVDALHAELVAVLDAAALDPQGPVASLGVPEPAVVRRPEFSFDL